MIGYVVKRITPNGHVFWQTPKNVATTQRGKARVYGEQQDAEKTAAWLRRIAQGQGHTITVENA